MSFELLRISTVLRKLLDVVLDDVGDFIAIHLHLVEGFPVGSETKAVYSASLDLVPRDRRQTSLHPILVDLGKLRFYLFGDGLVECEDCCLATHANGRLNDCCCLA